MVVGQSAAVEFVSEQGAQVEVAGEDVRENEVVEWVLLVEALGLGEGEAGAQVPAQACLPVFVFAEGIGSQVRQ